MGASSIYYTVSDDHGVLSSRVLAQSALPNDFTDSGVPWETIGAVTTNGTSLSVTLSYPTAAGLTADAVRLVRVTGDGAADDDFHVQPSSPTVDRGNPLSDFYAEPLPNGEPINQGFDANTAGARISAAQLVQVLSPNGGEKLNSNEPVNLSWRTSGLTANRPVLLIDSGGTGADNFVADEFGTKPGVGSFPQAVDLSGVVDPDADVRLPELRELRLPGGFDAVVPVARHGRELHAPAPLCRPQPRPRRAAVRHPRQRRDRAQRARRVRGRRRAAQGAGPRTSPRSRRAGRA